MVIGLGTSSTLPMEGSLPPDLQGTLLRVGPRPTGSVRVEGADTTETPDGADGPSAERTPTLGGALHAVELRDGKAASYLWQKSPADAGVFWHAGSVLALPESGMPSQYSRLLEPQEFGGALTVPIASHVHRVASDGSRVLFSVDDTTVPDDGADHGVWLRLGEWDSSGALRTAQSVGLERATWQHDVGVTDGHVVFVESPTARLAEPGGSAVPFGWVPGAEGWLGVVPRGGGGTGVRWFSVDPCLVTHVLGAWEEEGDDIVFYVCRYDAPEAGRPVDVSASVVGPEGIGRTLIGGSLAVLERWRVTGDRLERSQVDERHLEYPRMDPQREGAPFRFGYGVELVEDGGGPRTASGETSVAPVGLLKFDLTADEVRPWSPGPGRQASEPLFVRSRDGHSDEEGWLLSVVYDSDSGTSDLYVLDASTMARRGPEAVIHLPVALPFRSHGEWVPADRYR